MSKLVIESNDIHPIYAINLVMYFLEITDRNEILYSKSVIVKEIESERLDNCENSYVVECENQVEDDLPYGTLHFSVKKGTSKSKIQLDEIKKLIKSNDNLDLHIRDRLCRVISTFYAHNKSKFESNSKMTEGVTDRIMSNVFGSK